MTKDKRRRNKRTPQYRAQVITDRWRDRGYSAEELYALEWFVLHYYLDSYNYKNVYNLRVAKKFDTEEMAQYFDQADRGKHKFFERTVYAGGKLDDGGSEFYFGFNYE